MQQVIQLGRVVRERNGLSLKMPLSSAVVIADEQHLKDLDSVTGYIQEELNLRTVTLSTDEAKYHVKLEARVDWPTLGKKLKKQAQVVRKALPGLSQAQLRDFQHTKVLELEGIRLEPGDITIVRSVDQASAGAGSDGAKWEAAFAEDMMVLLDTTTHAELQEEGLVRDLISRVQKLRKLAKLVPTEDVHMQYAVLSNPNAVGVDEAVATHKNLFLNALRGELVKSTADSLDTAETCLLKEDQEISGVTLRLALLKC